MSWVERKPEQTDIPNRELASLLTSNKQTFRQALERYSFWTDSSGVSAGQPRFSAASAGPGGFRAFFDVESNTSSALTSKKALSGRLYLASDTSVLYGYSSINTLLSNATIPLGSNSAIVFTGSSFATIATQQRILAQSGSLSSNGTTSAYTIAYGSTYSAVPSISLAVISAGTTALWAPVLNTSGTTNFNVSLAPMFGAPSTFTILWRSHGSVAI